MSKPVLKLDWCSYEAAKYAVEKWHYSQRMPVSKSARIGVWEGGEFIGAILFAWGANPHMSKTVGLDMVECAELVRVAMRSHASPVSRMLAIAVRMLKKQSPGLRCLVSYADPYHDHHGGIYQACGWAYAGETAPEVRYMHQGQMLMRRAYSGSNFGRGKMAMPTGATKITVPGKHKYLMPLDAEMKARIAPLARPYPKRPCAGSADSGTSAIQAGGGGANPTPALSNPPMEG